MIETRTYRAPSLREAMRLAHRDMGTTAMVVHSGPVHVPRQPRPVAFDVVAPGEPTLPATEAPTGVGTLPLDGRSGAKLRKLWHASRPIAPRKSRTNPAKTATVHHLKPLSTPSERLTERLAELRNRCDFFVRAQETANVTPGPAHLRLVQELNPEVADTRAPWEREAPPSVALVGPRGAANASSATWRCVRATTRKTCRWRTCWPTTSRSWPPPPRTVEFWSINTLCLRRWYRI